MILQYGCIDVWGSMFDGNRLEISVVVIPFFSELELELYLLRKEAELELAELNQHLELAPPLESVPLLELAPGIQCLGHSN